MTAPDYAIALEIAGALVSVAAAVFGLRAASNEARPVWDDDPSLKPKNMAQDAFGWAKAVAQSNYWAGRSAFRSAWLALLAAVLIVSAVALRVFF